MGFSFRQRGRPNGEGALVTRTGGAGALHFRREDLTDDHKAGDPRIEVGLRGVITESDDPSCVRGASVVFRLHDGAAASRTAS